MELRLGQSDSDAIDAERVTIAIPSLRSLHCVQNDKGDAQNDKRDVQNDKRKKNL